MITIDGNQFRINGVRRPYVFRSSFCLMAYYLNGNRNAARDWLDRIQEQGFDGPRVFGENQDWSGGPFYGLEQFTPRAQAFPESYSGAFSKLPLVSGYKEAVRQLIEDLNARHMVGEFCCIATVKGRDTEWTEHGLNRFAQMFRELLGSQNNSPLIFETVNEVDAHSKVDSSQWPNLGLRWRRVGTDEAHHNFPGSVVGISAGGKWEPGFDDLSYTHRNIHPPRGEKWYLGRDKVESITVTIETLKNKNGANSRPLAFNETVHYMTPEQWDYWVPRIPKWAGLSTMDNNKLARWTDDVLKAGVSVCAHDLIGQMTDPYAPISRMEEDWAEILGGSVAPPEPEPHFAYGHIVEKAYQDVLLREVDPSGLESWNGFLANGGTEAQLREILMRSPEFKERFEKNA